MRRLFSSLGVALMLNLLTKPAWLLLENAVQDRVGHAAYGLFSALYSLGLLVSALTDLGINQYLTKIIATQPDRFHAVVRATFGLKLGLSVAYFGLVVVFGYLLGYGEGLGLKLLIPAGLTHLLISLLMYIRGLLQGLQQFKTDAAASVADKTLLMGLVAALFAINWLDIETFAWANVASLAIAVVLFGLLLMLRMGWPGLHLPGAEGRRLLRSSLPFALIIILYGLQERINQIILERTVGEQANGIYAGAYRWISAISMYLWTVLPIFYAKFAAGFADATTNQQRLFDVGKVVVALPLALICGFIWNYGEVLFFLFAQSNPAEVHLMTLNIKILAVGLFLNALFQVYSTYLTATGRERYVNALLVVSIVPNAAITYLAGPYLGSLAASLGLLSSFMVLSAGFVWAFARSTPLAVPWRLLLKLLAVIVLSLGLMWLLQNRGWPWYAAPIPAGIVMLAGALVFKLVPVPGLRRKQQG